MFNYRIYAYFASMDNADTIKQYRWVIGIDPDCERNGIATLEIATHKLEVSSLKFADTLDYLYWLKEKSTDDKSVIVMIEAGWLNRSNWHLMRFDSKAKSAAKGNAVGRNHEVGRKLAEMCEHWNLPYRLVKPLKKVWQGKDGKITATELQSFTGLSGRTNQEERDAALLAWVSANQPIKILKSRKISKNTNSI